MLQGYPTATINRKKVNLRAQLKPIFANFPEPKLSGGFSSLKSFENLLLVPRSKSKLQLNCQSSQMLNLPALKKSQSPTPTKSSKPSKQAEEDPSKSSRKTPPHIRKLANFWQKIGNIEPAFKGFFSPQSITTRKPIKKETLNVKTKFAGIPARFREVGKKIEEKIGFSKDMDKKRIQKDLYIIKVNDGSDLKERLEVAKLARRYHDGKGFDQRLEDNWRWFTPKSSASERSMNSELELKQHP